jgi:hypothetical protein
MNQTKDETVGVDKIAHCARCHRPTIDRQLLMRWAKCRSCGWEGPEQDLVWNYYQHTFANKDAILHAFTMEMRSFLQDHAIDLTMRLRRWGFLHEKSTPTEVAQYLQAVHHAVSVALIETRDKIVCAKDGKGNES